MVLTIHGEHRYLWRAVDQDGHVLDILAQHRRDKKAAKRFFHEVLKGLMPVTRVIITDKLKSYGTAKREMLPSVEHRQHRYLNHRAEAPQQQMSEAEVITPASVAILFFRGSFEAARTLRRAPWYRPHMLIRSRLNRRLHPLNDLLVTLYELLGHTWKHPNAESVYILDSFPIAVCDNYRIPRAKVYRHEGYRGYIASKKRHFYGLKIHLLVTKDGQPIECSLTPGSYSDVRVSKTFQLDLPEGSHIYADKGYNDYELEDALIEAGDIQLCPLRKKNSTRAVPPYLAYVQHYYRRMIETVGSLIGRILPKTIPAVTAAGFELKVFLFVLAYRIKCL